MIQAASALVTQQPTGALTGKIVYTSGGHGYTANSTASGAWTTGRPLSNGIVEDFGNQDQMTQFAYYAFNAGATVVPMRPIGNQPNEVILDNSSAGVTFTGAWAAGGTGSGTHYFYANSANPASRYMVASGSATETAVARYTPTISVAGVYPVYGWAMPGSDRLIDQTYRITYAGGTQEVRVNHRMVGNGWVYLGSYQFNAGASGYVEISNKSGSTGNAIADAIRFGNGMGDIARGGAISGHTREDEGSLYWVQKQAQNTYRDTGSGTASLLPTSTYRGTFSSTAADSDVNVGAPIRWAVFMNNESVGNATDRVFLSFHTNASGAEGGTRGTIGLYNGNNRASAETPHQFDLALDVAREINNDLVSINSQLENSWFNRTSTTDLTLDRTDIEFGEINNETINDEFDATIAEVGFHDNTQDAADLLDPKVRAAIGRASTQGVIRYFNTFAGSAVNFAPSIPTGLKALAAANGDITVSWQAPAASAAGGDAATSYLLQTSADGKSFDGGFSVAGTNYTFAAASLGSSAQFFRVLAVNAGGTSPTSVVAGARKNPYGKSNILIVNGFDRLDRAQDPAQVTKLSTTDPDSITAYRIRPELSNSFDYVSQAGLAIAAFGTPLGFDSVQHADVASGSINLANYDTVIWLSGEESSADLTFTSTEQSAVANFVIAGGHLFVSGSEVGYDLVSKAHGASFYNNTLHAGYAGDSANTYNVTGAGGSIFAGLSFSFDNGTQTYNVDFPDRLTASGGSTIAMLYSGGTGDGAAIQYSGANGSKVVNFGFPFETITTAAARANVMGAVLTYFGVANPSAQPTAVALAAASDTGNSSSDGITKLNSGLQFSVTGSTPGATITLTLGGTIIGTAVATGATTLVPTTLTFADGIRSVLVTQTTPGKAASAAASGQFQVDTIAPTLTANTFSVSPAQVLTLKFSESVAASLDANDLAFVNRNDNTVPQNWVVTTLGTTTDIRFNTGTANVLADGNFQANLNFAGIADLAGNVLASTAAPQFFFYAGDFTQDRKVNIVDLGILAGSYGKSGMTYADGDANYSGNVDIVDLGLLAGNYGKQLDPPAQAAAIMTSSSVPPKKKLSIAVDVLA